MEAENLALVQRYLDNIAAGDLEAALALCSIDAAFRGPDGTAMDKDGLRALFAMIAPLMINPLELKTLGTTCQGRRVAVEATGRTLLANGREYANLYHFIFEVDGGIITASREYCDTGRAAAFA